MIISLKGELCLEPCHISMMDPFGKIDYDQRPLTIYSENLHHKYLT